MRRLIRSLRTGVTMSLGRAIARGVGVGLVGLSMAVGSAAAQTGYGLPYWSEPSGQPHDAVTFPFPFTWPSEGRTDLEIVNVGGAVDDAVTYRVNLLNGGYVYCMRVGEMNTAHYAVVFREGDLACGLNAYQFTSAQKMNAFISHQLPGTRLFITGYRRVGNSYSQIQETVTLRAIEF